MSEAEIDTHERNSRTLAYVLKGFPRFSELFIASEIYRLEQARIPLRLFVIRPSDEQQRHEVVDRISVKPEYLPPVISMSGTRLPRWLMLTLRTFLPGLLRLCVRRPLGIARACCWILTQAIRGRPSFWGFPRIPNIKQFLQATALADQLISAGDVRHLHAHFCHSATTVTWLASMITHIPFSFTAHAKDIYSETLNPAGLLKRKLDAARFVVTCTDTNRRHLQKLTKTKVHYIYHGLNVDLSLLLENQGKPSARNGGLRALAVGRLVPKKGFDVFVEACGILKRRGVAFEALIVGPSNKDETEHEAKIKRIIAKQQLEAHVRLVGPLSQQALFEEYHRATALCMPCRVLESGDRDGIPNVLPEAMACGLPVISTAVSGVPEIVTHNANGLLVAPNDPEALADALLQIQSDPVLAQRLSQRGRKIVAERFNGKKSAGLLAALFREVLQ